MDSRQRSLWAWGYRGEEPGADEQAQLALMAKAVVGGDLEPRPSPAADRVSVPTSRVDVPAELRSLVETDALVRASHTYGRGYPDLVRGFACDFSSAPDAVAYPSNEDELSRLLEWCERKGLGAIPFGGGTSVVGGVEPRLSPRYNGALTLDLSRFSGVHEIDGRSRVARIGAGSTGPLLESELAESGMTLRHYPQSFAHSTLGGWLATRAGGHFATRSTHIDDLTQAIRMITPRGEWSSLAVPASGAGPSPDRLVLGSEGALGIITEAWMRVRPRPTHRASASMRFDEFDTGLAAIRELAQTRLYPDNCRLLDANEAMLHRVSMDRSSVLVLGFEGQRPVDFYIDEAVEIARDCGGRLSGDVVRWAEGDDRERAAEESAWRRAFLRGPYLLNVAVSIGLLVDTFETAVTWTRFDELHEAVLVAAKDVMQRECGGGFVSCRVTHVYPDGLAPYYTVVAPTRSEAELSQWQAIKDAITGAFIAHGGTVTHHHAVGRVHMPWYRLQRPALFGEALAEVKNVVDPAHILNPGVLVDD